MKTAILTSIPLMVATDDAQRRYEEQQRCIDSWIRAGHIPVSINHQGQIPLLEKRFPNVRFALINRSRSVASGNSLVSISDALKTGLMSDFDRLALCNPDVLITYPSEFASLIPKDLPLAFTRRKRNYAYADGVKANEEDYSLDYINLSTDFARSVQDAEFSFDQPWWDYWLALEALKVQPPVELTSELGELLANQLVSYRHENDQPSTRLLIDYALHCFARVADVSLAKVSDRSQIEGNIDTLVSQREVPLQARGTGFFQQLKIQVSVFIRAHAKQMTLSTHSLYDDQ